MPDIPIYMLIFNDQLKRLNASQKKYEPKLSAAAAAATSTNRSPARVSENTNFDRPSVSYTASARSVDPSKNSSANLRSQSGPSPENSTEPTRTSSFRSQTSQSNRAADQLHQEQPQLNSEARPLRQSDVGHRAAIAIKELNLKVIPLVEGRTTSSVFQRRSNSSTRPPGLSRSTTSNPTPFDTGLPSNNPLQLDQLPPAPEPDSNLLMTTNKDSYPNVSQTPNAQLGNSTNSNRVSTKEPTSDGRKRQPKTAATSDSKQQPVVAKEGTPPRQSMSKTIVDATPNAFKTLGPGFNRMDGQSSLTNSSLAASAIPSDYEHIFHAPSQLMDQASTPPATVTTSKEGKRRKKSSTKKQQKPKPSGETKRKVAQNPQTKPKAN